MQDVPDTFHSDKEYYETLLSHVAEELRAQVPLSIPGSLLQEYHHLKVVLSSTHWAKHQWCPKSKVDSERRNITKAAAIKILHSCDLRLYSQLD